MSGYIQIYQIMNLFLTPSGKERVEEYKVMITHDESNLYKTGFNSNNGITIMQNQNVKVLDTFKIDINKLYPVFAHSRDRVLDVMIEDNIITIIGDYQLVLVKLELPINMNINRIPLTLRATNKFLKENGFPTF
jgi:hypothetical protein